MIESLIAMIGAMVILFSNETYSDCKHVELTGVIFIKIFMQDRDLNVQLTLTGRLACEFILHVRVIQVVQYNLNSSAIMMDLSFSIFSNVFILITVMPSSTNTSVTFIGCQLLLLQVDYWRWVGKRRKSSCWWRDKNCCLYVLIQGFQFASFKRDKR